MRVLLPLKKKTKGNNHQHQHLLEDQDEGEEQLEGQHQQQQQPEEAHPEPRSAPQFAASTSAVGPTSVAATVASSVPAAATAACPSDTETPVFEPSKKRARTNIHSTEPAAAFLLQNSKPAAVARSEVELELELELDPPVVSIHNNTSSSSMAGGRLYPQDEEDDDTDHLGWRQGTAAASASTAARASMTTAGTADTAAAVTTASTSATTTPLENEPPPVNNNCDGHESNHTHMNYHYNNNRNSHRNPHVARSAASAHTNTHAATDNKSNRSNDPAGDIADDDDANDDANDANDDDQVTDSFRQALKKRGLEIVVQEGDGNCLFRAVSLQVYGDSSMHADVRQQCLDFMARDPEHFGQFVVLAVGQATFSDYIARKRQDSVHGNNPEIQAISELFNRPVEVFTPASTAANCQPLNIFHAEYKTADAPIRLSYHDGNHYNAVIDPLVPTAGLGLGLPGLKPGLADQMQVAKAVTESDQLADEMELARVLKESARDHNDDYLKRALTESSYDSQMANVSLCMCICVVCICVLWMDSLIARKRERLCVCNERLLQSLEFIY
jgi:hypothetical protein